MERKKCPEGKRLKTADFAAKVIALGKLVAIAVSAIFVNEVIQGAPRAKLSESDVSGEVRKFWAAKFKELNLKKRCPNVEGDICSFSSEGIADAARQFLIESGFQIGDCPDGVNVARDEATDVELCEDPFVYDCRGMHVLTDSRCRM